MAYEFKQNLVSVSKHSIKCPNSMTPAFVVIHNTYNDASAANEVKYMISNNNQVSYHVAVDDKEVIQALPLNRNAWACGDGSNGPGNRKGISIEICYSKSGGSRYAVAEENAVYVAARLLQKYNLGIDELKQHADFANKNCPHRIRDEKRWDEFKGRVQWVLDEIKKGTIESSLEAGTTETKKTMPSTTGKDQWKKNDKGWWYEYADGSYPTNKWLKIDNEWYYFGNDGYAYCNKWVKWNDVWYWLDKDCKMVKDCILLINGKYYAFDKDGKMKTDVEVSDNGDLIL